jgi:hypothetical protein
MTPSRSTSRFTKRVFGLLVASAVFGPKLRKDILYYGEANLVPPKELRQRARTNDPKQTNFDRRSDGRSARVLSASNGRR